MSDGHPHPKATPPFAVETYKSGCAIVVDANGINWGTDKPGAVLFGSPAEALAWCRSIGLQMREET